MPIPNTAPNQETQHTSTPRTKQLPVRMPEEVYNALKGVAYFTERSMNEIVVAAITEHLRRSSDGELDRIVKTAQQDYQQVLDKLANL